MTAESDLVQLLATMRPVLKAGEFVFVSSSSPLTDPALAMVREPEGMSYVISRNEADRRSLAYDFVAAWITLDVHSSLASVGFAAAIATELAAAGISCNLIAGYFHDHLLVPLSRAEDAVQQLRELSRRYAS